MTDTRTAWQHNDEPEELMVYYSLLLNASHYRCLLPVIARFPTLIVFLAIISDFSNKNNEALYSAESTPFSHQDNRDHETIGDNFYSRLCHYLATNQQPYH